MIEGRRIEREREGRWREEEKRRETDLKYKITLKNVSNRLLNQIVHHILEKKVYGCLHKYCLSLLSK